MCREKFNVSGSLPDYRNILSDTGKKRKKLQARFPQLRAQNAATVTINSISGDFSGVAE
jgi:hypothetical protein